MFIPKSPQLSDRPARQTSSPRWSLGAALLGFFVITLDALVVSVALPAIRDSLGGGISALQWVIDGYTLPFAALLLLAGSLSDRLGAKWAFGMGLIGFTLSSVACAFAPTIGWLIVSRAAQGMGAALMTPASLALIGEAYVDPTSKARAIGLWAVGGAVASAAGPLVGGALTMVSWRLIFLINLPVGLLALWLLTRVAPSRREMSQIDWSGQVTSFVALLSLTVGLIEAGTKGIAQPMVIACLSFGVLGGVIFILLQRRSPHPMVPLHLFRPRPAVTAVAIGFAFMVGFFGMVFLVSLYLQEHRGLSPLQTGVMFVPVTGFSIVMPIIAARLAERFGAWLPITAGQVSMILGLSGVAFCVDYTSLLSLIACMSAVGVGGGLAMPSATSMLLNTIPPNRAGTASGVLNTSRQVGGALAIAAFGALVAGTGFVTGMRISLAIAVAVLAATTIASLALHSRFQANPSRRQSNEGVGTSCPEPSLLSQ